MGPEFLTAVNAKTALETPQILLDWTFDSTLTTPLSEVPWEWTSMVLRRSLDRYPESSTEGDSVLAESYSATPTVSTADLALEPLKNYYYSLLFYYREHSASPIVLDDNIGRLGGVFAGAKKEDTPALLSRTDGVKNSTTTFTSATAQFLTNNVQAGFLLRITDLSADAGYHEIASVDSETQVTLTIALTTSGAATPFAIHTDHQIFWIGGVDYHRKPVLWRYDEENNMVLHKIDLSALLGFEEFVTAVGFAGTLLSTDCVGIYTTSNRWLRFPRDIDEPQPSDVIVDLSTSGLIDSGGQITGVELDPNTLRVWMLDSINMEIQVVSEAGAYIGRRWLNGLEEVAEGTLVGLSLDLAGAKVHVGNRNYVMRVPMTLGVGSFTPASVDRVTYTRNKIRADLGYYIDRLTSLPYVVVVDDVIDKIQTYKVEVARGGLWQQPYVADSATIGLYHLDETAGISVADTSQYANTGTNVGMAFETGRYSGAFESTLITDHVSIIAIAGEWNGDEGSVSLWVKATTATDLTTGDHRMFVVEASSTNRVHIKIAGGQLVFERVAASVSQAVTLTHPKPDTEWHQYECTWTKSGNEFKAYLDGDQLGTTKTGLAFWAGGVATASIADSGNSLQGLYDEVRISNVARAVHTTDYAWTTPNKLHAFSGRSYTTPYLQGDPLGFFYRDQIYTPKFMGGDYLIRNDYQRERLYPLPKVLSSGENIFRGPDPLPVLGDMGRLFRMFGLMLDRIADDRQAFIDNSYDLLKTDVDCFEALVGTLGIKGMDSDNWNVDMQRRFLRLVPLIYKRGGCASSYRILARLLGFYVTLHTLQARRRWDSVYYNANFDSNIQAIPLDTMGSMDTSDERYPLALLRFIFYKLAKKSSTGVTSVAGTRLLNDVNGNFTETAEVGSLIVVAQGQLDAGSLAEEAEYVVTQVRSDTQLKINRNWQVGNNTAVTYYNYWQVPVDDPDTDYMLTRFFDIAPDSMRIERYIET